MTNFDGKISAIFMNIATDTDSKESYKYFKDSIKYLMEEYSKEKLEAFIDDHFPEDSLNKYPPELEGTKWISGTFEGAGWRHGVYEYKVGDKVKIISKDSHFFPIGSIVTLTSVNNSFNNYQAKGKGPNEKGNEYFQNLNKKDFVLAELPTKFKVTPPIDKEKVYTVSRHPVESWEEVDVRSKPDASFTGDSLDHFVEGSWEVVQRQPLPDRPFTQYELDHPYYFRFKEKPIVFFSSPFKEQENPVKIKVEKAGQVKTVPPGKLSAYSLDLKRWVLDGEETSLGKVKIIGDEIHYNLRF